MVKFQRSAVIRTAAQLNAATTTFEARYSTALSLSATKPPALPGAHYSFTFPNRNQKNSTLDVLWFKKVKVSLSSVCITEEDKETKMISENYRSLQHTKWDCKYHVIFIPKYRKKSIYKELRKYLGELFRELARRKESEIEEGHLLVDHVHMLISIPPKYPVSAVVGFIKGKSAIEIARRYFGKKNLRGQSFWARGYLVTTVGRDETAIRKYIRNQENEECRLEQMKLIERKY